MLSDGTYALLVVGAATHVTAARRFGAASTASRVRFTSVSASSRPSPADLSNESRGARRDPRRPPRHGAARVPHAATAQSGTERITDYAVDIRIEPDGTLAIEEKIVYDFGSSPHHGIRRDLVRKERFDDHHDRRYDIEVTGVSASAGTPDDVQLSDEGSFRRIRIGDPNRTITGEHTYTIDYTVAGAPISFPDHDELFWDRSATSGPCRSRPRPVHVEAPADIPRSHASRARGQHAPACAEAARRSTGRCSGRPSCGAGAGMTIVVGLPKGAIQPDAEADPRASAARWATRSPSTAARSASAGALGGARRSAP